MDEIINPNLPTLIKKLILGYMQFFNILLIKENIIILPYSKSDNIKNNCIKKIIKKVVKLYKKELCNHIAISNNLKHYDFSIIRSKNINLINGSEIFKFFSIDILEYVAKQRKEEVSNLEVSILCSTYSSFMQENIILIAQRCKILNIVTNNTIAFKPIAHNLYNAFGITIRISNNRKKVLTKSDVILNYDFDETIFNQYALPHYPIVINFNPNCNISTKFFNGIISSSIKIDVSNELKNDFSNLNLTNAFDILTLYESIYFNNPSYSTLTNGFIKDNVHIKYLIGTKGPIHIKEFQKTS